jgi:hypothetical protein
MTVIARKGRNRIPLIGLLHTAFAAGDASRHSRAILSRHGDESAIFAGM